MQRFIAMSNLNIRFAQTVANASIATPLTGAEPPWHVLPAVGIVSVHIQRQLVGSTKLRSQTLLFHVRGKPGQIPNLMGGIYWAQKAIHCNRDLELHATNFFIKASDWETKIIFNFKRSVWLQKWQSDVGTSFCVPIFCESVAQIFCQPSTHMKESHNAS